MKAIDDPFRSVDWAIDQIQKETSLIFIDFHAEATAEKVSMGWHVDGRASVLIGNPLTSRLMMPVFFPKVWAI